MVKKLVINADGFGFTPGVNTGIVEAVAGGLITSVSCNANFEHIRELPELIGTYPGVSVGVHFNLSVGEPVAPGSEVASLVGSDGRFLGEDFVGAMMSGKIRFSQMKTELDAQARRLEELGAKISHWDGHQNKHLFPPFFLAAMQVAKAHGIRSMRTHRRYLFLQDEVDRGKSLRRYYRQNPRRFLTHGGGRLTSFIARRNGFTMADRLISPAYADSTAKHLAETWISIMRQLPKGVNEIYCHPGYPDDLLRKNASYVNEREDEVRVLTSQELKDAVAANHVQLVSFRDLGPDTVR